MKPLLILFCLFLPAFLLAADEPPPDADGGRSKASEEVQTKTEDAEGKDKGGKKSKAPPAVCLSKEADKRLLDLLGADQILVRMLAEEAAGEIQFQPGKEKMLKMLETGPPPQNAFPVYIRKMTDQGTWNTRKDVEKGMLLQERILIIDSLGKIGRLDSKTMERVSALAEKDEAELTREALAEVERIQVE